MASNSKKYVAIVDNTTTKEERDAFSEWLRKADPKPGFWHHIEHCWLLSVPGASTWTRETIHDKLNELMPQKYSIVFGPLEESSYMGYVPKNATEWLDKYFK